MKQLPCSKQHVLG